MASDAPPPSEGQDQSHGRVTAMHDQHFGQPPYSAQQEQYGQHGPDDSMGMASIAAVLPRYGQAQQYQMVNPGSGMPMMQASFCPQQAQHPHHHHHQTYQHGHAQMMQSRYPPYFEYHNRVGRFGHMQPQYSQNFYYGAQQAHHFDTPPAGYGTHSTLQQHGYQGMPPPMNRPPYGTMTGRSQEHRPSQASVPAAPRGPPRKPKQSGHALWVGNLPPGTRISDLKDHFSRDATEDIESVFLISKSNCAFVNYRSAAACAAAMSRFHDSRFQGVRLVCRLRKATGTTTTSAPTNIVSSGGTVPSGPAALQAATPGSAQIQPVVEALAQNHESSVKAVGTSAAQSGYPPVSDKYFVMKSLTVEDLELSVRNGIWATQGHNEDALNRAYESVDNVFLIFSANKSGEYFGYARMDSSIDDETARTLKWKSHHETQQAAAVIHNDPDLPRSIPTPATAFAPKGRIIDDSARGTIFWEADTDDSESEPREILVDGEIDDASRHSRNSDGSSGGDGNSYLDSAEESAVSGESESGAKNVETGTIDSTTATDNDTSSQHQSFGHPFRVQWISTARLPFYRTRGLRNPWNANREVKIARDGTEVETIVGRRLVTMFDRVHTQSSAQSLPLHLQLQMQMQAHQPFPGQLPQSGYNIPPYSRSY